jgi:hypothetical protein
MQGATFCLSRSSCRALPPPPPSLRPIATKCLSHTDIARALQALTPCALCLVPWFLNPACASAGLPSPFVECQWNFFREKIGPPKVALQYDFEERQDNSGLHQQNQTSHNCKTLLSCIHCGLETISPVWFQAKPRLTRFCPNVRRRPVVSVGG